MIIHFEDRVAKKESRWWNIVLFVLAVMFALPWLAEG